MQDQIIHNLSAIHAPSLFHRFLQGGFDCSTEWRGDGRRLDIANRLKMITENALICGKEA